MITSAGSAGTTDERAKVLLVDDEATGRRLLRRWIERCFDGHVVEAANGLEALEALAAEPFDLVVLDLMMPVLDGTETLSLIRSDPTHGDIEVVVASQLASEQKVKDVISLGVADYILKPLRYESVVDRLRQIIERARQKKRDRQQNVDQNCVLVADPDPNFCDFATSALSGHFQCFAVRTAAEALVAALKNGPNLILISKGLPGLPFDILCQKLASIGESNKTKILLLADAASQQADPRFDGELVRTFVPENFVARIHQLLGGAGVVASEGSESWIAALKPEVVSAVRQALGMMTGFEPTTVEAPATSADADIYGFIELVATSGDLNLRVELDGRRDFAIELCTTMLGGEASDVDDDLLVGGVGEILNVVGGRIKNSCSNRKIEVQLGLPKLTDVAPAPADSLDTWRQGFLWQHKHAFALRVIAQVGGAKCGGATKEPSAPAPLSEGSSLPEEVPAAAPSNAAGTDDSQQSTGSVAETTAAPSP